LAWVGIDLHIHSVLSPCGDWSMSPKNIIERVKKMNIGVIAITDHHMVENYPAISFWGERMGVLVIPGMEIQTSEEVHIVSLFEDYDTALKFQKDIFNYLPDTKNREEIFGVQVVVNEKDEVERIEERLLNTSISLNVTDTVKKIKEYGGIIILAHVDRPSFSIISNLGFIPKDLFFDFIELSNKTNHNKFISEHPELKDKKFLISSDAHYLEDIKEPKTFIYLEEFSKKAVFKSLKEKNIKIQGMEV